MSPYRNNAKPDPVPPSLRERISTAVVGLLTLGPKKVLGIPALILGLVGWVCGIIVCATYDGPEDPLPDAMQWVAVLTALATLVMCFVVVGILWVALERWSKWAKRARKAKDLQL